MAKWRFLSPHSIGINYFNAGDVASTSDVGGLLPAGFVGDGSCEPLDSAATTVFYNQGPQWWRPQIGSLSFQVSPPVSYWKVVGSVAGGMSLWQLTGLGAALAQVIGPSSQSN